ncbi:hypothetical protein CWATWH0402_1269 [Crocosphaera watsonii WH 0402]|uniref:Uncharacterized protein n=1 Tax=Crocosphaera watsonii WH 0402 TaxID=1284629 RepID=T2K0D7_CROWT|nr:hypothetical protein CWATWH0402_1269 [Crocosphaera watsonii WH 0402]
MKNYLHEKELITESRMKRKFHVRFGMGGVKSDFYLDP